MSTENGRGQMDRRILTEKELEGALDKLNGWTAEGPAIKLQRKFADFAAALDFVNAVGALAEAADHHPDIAFGWGYANVLLTTHDRGGVTDVDIAVASGISQIS